MNKKNVQSKLPMDLDLLYKILCFDIIYHL